VKFYAAALALLFTCFLVFAAIYFMPRQPPQAAMEIPLRVHDCRVEVRNAINKDRVTTEVWEQISNVCYMQVRGEAMLADFNIRRSNLINQQSEGRIVLWMVVAITISGVALAGLQLLAAYRLAGSGKGEFAASQEITLEQNRISLKSSVTGLMILVISFAFFMVYVVWVYTAKELRQEFPETAVHRSLPVDTPLTTTGGYGPPPTTSVGSAALLTPITIPAKPATQPGVTPP
jgi:hypothetical protein